MKKIISIAAIALCVCLIIAAVCIEVFKIGHDEATIKVESVSANPGDTVMIPISVSGNPGISDIAFKLEFDTSVLTYKTFYESILKGCEVYDHSSEGYIKLASIDNDGIKDEGNLAYIAFTVNDKAETGTVPFNLESLCFDNAKGRSVKVETQNGELKITEPCSEEHTYSEAFLAKPNTCTTRGLLVEVCSACGHNNPSTVDPSGHKLNNEFVLDLAPQNGEPGMISQHCSVCGAKTNIIIFAEDNGYALGINSSIEGKDPDEVQRLVYFINGGVTYPDVTGDTVNIKQLLESGRLVKNADGSINVDVAIDDALNIVYGEDTRGGIRGTMRRAAIADELPLLAKLLYWFM